VGGYIFIIVILILMWFLLIRPQRRRQVDSQRLLDSLSVGQEIVTAGGLYGTIKELDEDEARIEIAEGIEVRVAKRAIAGVVSEDEPEEEPEEEHEDDPNGLPDPEETPGTLP
jgi:preprotein translocase subunit YajC